MKLERQRVIRGTLYCRTGLRIGGSQDQLEIGAVDNPVIKHPLTGDPYVPGSSLKGKMRSRLEWVAGLRYGSEPCRCAEPTCLVCRVFGPHKQPKHSLGPTRLLVRDAILSDTSQQAFAVIREGGGSPLEVKTENMIDRQTGVATHPRPVERVPSGTTFDLELVVQILDMDISEQREADMLNLVRQGLRLVQEHYLGAGGSRGYGQVEFRNLTLDGEPWPLEDPGPAGVPAAGQ